MSLSLFSYTDLYYSRITFYADKLLPNLYAQITSCQVYSIVWKTVRNIGPFAV